MKPYSPSRLGIPCIVLSLVAGLIGPYNLQAVAAPSARTTAKQATTKKPQYVYEPGSYEEDTLILTPNAGAENDEIAKAIKETGGTVVARMEHRGTVMYKIQVPKGKLLQAEKSLHSDDNFSGVVRNCILQANAPIAVEGKPDPWLPQEWHLNAIHAREATDYLAKNNHPLSQVMIAMPDTGCQASTVDMSDGRVSTGFQIEAPVAKTVGGVLVVSNAAAWQLDQGINPNIKYGPGTGNVDPVGHGTQLGTTIAAIPNNGVGTAGVAPNAKIYPARITKSRTTVNSWDLAEALGTIADKMQKKTEPIKIVCLAYNSGPPNSMVNPNGANSFLIRYFKEIYEAGGLVFISSGNPNRRDTSPRSPYAFLVSGMMKNNKRLYYTANGITVSSSYGPPVWFTCPGVHIYCSGQVNNVVVISGTSAAAAICSAAAAVIWGANPNLSNTQVRDLMIETADRSFYSTALAPEEFGYGLPNCYAAVKKMFP